MKTLVVFDLEATCWDETESIDRAKSEIIEIGAVRIDKETAQVLNTFQIFVKPTVNRKLSDYCKNLTKITQEDVDSACEFSMAMDSFTKWLSPTDEYILSWGYYDKNQIEREADTKSYTGEILNILKKSHINMKNQFAHIYNTRQCGMTKALKKLNLELQGTHHRGIDDALNMARIYEQMKDKFFGEIFGVD